MKKKYIVVAEGNDGYMECAGITDSLYTAVGIAYLWLARGEPNDKFYVTTGETREGGNGVVMFLVEKETNEITFSVTVLTFEEEKDE